MVNDPDDIARRARIEEALAKADDMLAFYDGMAARDEERTRQARIDAVLAPKPKAPLAEPVKAARAVKPPARSCLKHDAALVRAAMDGSAELLKRVASDLHGEIAAVKSEIAELRDELAALRKPRAVA